MGKDMKGYQINDLYDYSPQSRTQYLHLALFPMENSSFVIAFYHKRDRNYQKIE